MSTGKGKQMKKALERWVAAAFRAKGFTGKFPVLRRVRGGELDIIELQFTKYGGGFRLNLGVCPAEGITTKWGESVKPQDLTTAYEMKRRYFLDPRNVKEEKKGKHWFEFGENDTDQIARSFLPNVELADRWFLTGEAPRLAAAPRPRGGPIHRFVMKLLRPCSGARRQAKNNESH